MVTVDFETIASPLDVDVASFAKRVKDDGGYVDAKTLAALDQFVRRGQAVGWYSAIVEMYPFVGNNLTAALKKFKYHASSGPSLTNHNFVEADYDQTVGFGTYNLADTTKYLTTGVVPATCGMNNNTAGMFACAGDLPSTFAFGEYENTSGEKTSISWRGNGSLIFNNSIGLAVGSINDSLRVHGASCYAGGIKGWVDSIQIVDTPDASAGLFENEIYIFITKQYGWFYEWQQGKAGCIVLLNVALTAAQGADLCKAVRKLQADIGRRAWQPMPRLGAIGDSNSVGPAMQPTKQVCRCLRL